MNLIVHKRELGESVHEFIKASDPEIAQVNAILDKLSAVLTDMFGVECRVRIHASHAQLRAAIAKAKAEEGAA